MHEAIRRIVFGHPDALVRAEVGYQLCRLGWETHTAATGPESRRLACRWRPELVILASDFPDESGWLTCAKLSRERPGQQILLLDSDVTPADRRFARFSGAARVLSERRGMTALLDAVCGTAGVTAADVTAAG
jgi:DNA-binding response OmpR family regulator